MGRGHAISNTCARQTYDMRNMRVRENSKELQ